MTNHLILHHKIYQSWWDLVSSLSKWGTICCRIWCHAGIVTTWSRPIRGQEQTNRGSPKPTGLPRTWGWWHPQWKWTDRQHHNTLRPRQNGRHFADDTFKPIFLNENIWISIKISLKFVPKVPINNIPALVQIMAWRRPGDKPLSEPMMVSLLTHICVTRPQWVNPYLITWA